MGKGVLIVGGLVLVGGAALLFFYGLPKILQETGKASAEAASNVGKGIYEGSGALRVQEGAMYTVEKTKEGATTIYHKGAAAGTKVAGQALGLGGFF